MTNVNAKAVRREQARAALRERYVCHDCAARPPRGDYMVHSEIWQRAEMPLRGFLCLTCLESRLVARGHGKLTIADFTSAPCNAELRFGYDLALRVKETRTNDERQ